MDRYALGSAFSCAPKEVTQTIMWHLYLGNSWRQFACVLRRLAQQGVEGCTCSLAVIQNEVALIRPSSTMPFIVAAGRVHNIVPVAANTFMHPIARWGGPANSDECCKRIPRKSVAALALGCGGAASRIVLAIVDVRGAAWVTGGSAFCQCTTRVDLDTNIKAAEQNFHFARPVCKRKCGCSRGG